MVSNFVFDKDVIMAALQQSLVEVKGKLEELEFSAGKYAQDVTFVDLVKVREKGRRRTFVVCCLFGFAVSRGMLLLLRSSWHSPPSFAIRTSPLWRSSLQSSQDLLAAREPTKSL